MKINNKDYDIESLINKLEIEKINENNSLKKRTNGLILSDNQIAILNKHGIKYENFNNLSSLIFSIEEYIMEVESYIDIKDIEEISIQLSEQNYYQNTNK